MAVARKVPSLAPAFWCLVLGVALSIVTAVFATPLWAVPLLVSFALCAHVGAGVELTGPKDRATGARTPEGGAQASKLARLRLFQALSSNTLKLGGASFLPGRDMRLSFIAALFLSVASAFAPSEFVDLPWWARLVGGAATLVCVLALDATLRTRFAPDVFVGTRISDLKVSILGIVTSALVVALAVTAGVLWGFWLFDFCLALSLVVFTLSWVSRKERVRAWKDVRQARRIWEGRWEALKVSPPPTFLARDHHGSITVDSFQVPPSTSADSFTMGVGAERILRTLDGTALSGVCPAGFEEDPERLDRNLFRVVTCLEPPQIVPGETSCEQVALWLQVALSDASLELKAPAPLVAEVEMIDGAYLAFFAQGTDFHSLRFTLADAVRSALGTDVLVDHRNAVFILGDLENVSDGVPLPRSFSDTAQYFESLALEDQWRERWGNILATPEHAPTLQFLARSEAHLDSTTTITSLPFALRQGMTPAEFVGLDAKLATALSSAPFVAITSYPQDRRRGLRHPGAINILYSHSPVPSSPDTVVPNRDNLRACDWLLSSMVEKAFLSAKLARPMVTEVKPLTSQDSHSHIWQVKVRLFDTSLEQVRAKRSVLISALQSPWFRLRPADDEGQIYLYVGAKPQDVVLGRRDFEKLVCDLDWEEAWASAGVVNPSGKVPTLAATDHFPANEQVQILDFDLPPSLSLPQIKAVTGKLKVATGNAFLEVFEGVSGPASIRAFASVHDPMPSLANHDVDLVHQLAASDPLKLPLGTSVSGEPILWDRSVDPHLKVIGTTGAGKSVGIQNALFSSILSGFDVVVVDSVKEATDFEFARPYALAFATDIFAAAGVMERAYEEVRARVALNAQYKVGSYLDLPPEVRPKEMLVVIDEFTSAISLDTVPPQSDSPVVEAERAKIAARNNAKLKLGTIAGKLGREARSAGVALLLGGQKLAVEDLKKVGAGELKGMMATLFVGKPKSQGDLMSALSSWELAPDLGASVPKGRGMFESMVSAPEMIQVWFDPDKQDFFTRHLQSLGASPVAEPWDLSAFTAPEDGPPIVQDVFIGDENVVEDLGTQIVDWGDETLPEDVVEPDFLLVSTHEWGQMSRERKVEFAASALPVAVWGDLDIARQVFAQTLREDLEFFPNLDQVSSWCARSGFDLVGQFLPNELQVVPSDTLG